MAWAQFPQSSFLSIKILETIQETLKDRKRWTEQGTQDLKNDNTEDSLGFLYITHTTDCVPEQAATPKLPTGTNKKKSPKKKKKEIKEKEKQSFISPNKDQGKESLAGRLIPVAAVGSSAYGSFTS